MAHQIAGQCQATIHLNALSSRHTCTHILISVISRNQLLASLWPAHSWFKIPKIPL